MRTLLLIRHAKSSWENFIGDDIDRPLNERGTKNAPEMARRLLARGIAIGAFISSPARRALTTAILFAAEYGVEKEDIIVIPSLYMAGPTVFSDVIRKAPPSATTVAIFSHNNGITEYANILSDIRIDNMPTSAVFAIECGINEWRNFDPAKNNRFYFFDYPRSAKVK